MDLMWTFRINIKLRERVWGRRVGSSLWVMRRREARLHGGCSEHEGWMKVRTWVYHDVVVTMWWAWISVNARGWQCPLGIKVKVRELLWDHCQASPDTQIYSFTTYMCATWDIHSPPLLLLSSSMQCCIQKQRTDSKQENEEISPVILL